MLQRLVSAVSVSRTMERRRTALASLGSFGLIGQLWTVYVGTLFTAKDVAMMLALLKVARIHNGDKMDSFIDLAGYAACAGEIVGKETP